MASPDQKQRTPPRGAASAGGQPAAAVTTTTAALSPKATGQKENPLPLANKLAVSASAGKGKLGSKPPGAAAASPATAVEVLDDTDDMPLAQLQENQQQHLMSAAAPSKSSPKSSGGAAAAASSSSLGAASSYFMAPSKNSVNATSSSANGAKKFVQQTISFGVSKEPFLQQQLVEKDAALRESEHRASVAEHELARLKRVQADLALENGDQSARMARYQEAMAEVMKESARTCRREARRALANKVFELGHQTVIATPMGNKEVWVQGNLMRQLNQELAQIKEQQQTLDSRKAALDKQKKAVARLAEKAEKEKTKQAAKDAATHAGKTNVPNNSNNQNHQNNNNNNNDDDNSNEGGDPFCFGGNNMNNDNSNQGQSFMMLAASSAPDTALLDAEEELENIKQELLRLKLLEGSRKATYDDGYSTERIASLKEKARIQYEDQSDFASVPAIGEHGRYVLMYLLGKGGFSEVWRAFDLVEGRHVACKIHRVRREWNQASRDNYMRHARRELEIQRSLDHPRLTKLYDVFECNAQGEALVTTKDTASIGSNALMMTGPGAAETLFVSVMEFSAGEDLDTHLKRVRKMPEQEARVVFMQIVAGLRHLWEQKDKIIHYDLKPANIIFHSSLPTCLDIKVCDFGLSKIIVEGSAGEDGQIEQTSPGAGTYWYLPPECFGDTQSQSISAKVDIWAAGVIFFQMLYGRRPFAHDDSQRRIWQEKLIVAHAQKPVEFPDKPVVSSQAKDLIRRCLTFNTAERPDVIALSNDQYLRQASRRRPRSATPAAAHLAVPGGIVGGLEFQVPAPVPKK